MFRERKRDDFTLLWEQEKSEAICFTLRKNQYLCRKMFLSSGERVRRNELMAAPSPRFSSCSRAFLAWSGMADSSSPRDMSMYPVAFSGVAVFVLFKRKVAYYAANICGKKGRILRRDGVPYRKVCVVDAFIAVLPAVQYPVRDHIAQAPVICVGLVHGQRVACVAQFYDPGIFHSSLCI